MKLWAAPALLVMSALAQADEDIRDIRGPKTVPRPWLPLSVVAGAVVVALCAYLLWRRQRRRARRQTPSLSTQTLERLEATRPLMRPATAREFAIAASEILRNYIEQRFHVVATQRTTEEFLQTLLHASDETLTRHRPLLGEFLNQCDFVKFAGASLSSAHMELLLQRARGFVLETATPAAPALPATPSGT
jgi:hypothetical protein